MDEAIYKKEGEYLEDTPHGNVLTGFDNYIKGVTSNAVARRKQGVSDNDRVFSRSSVRLADFMVWKHGPFPWS
jgi:chromatin modification-related protein EAF6